MKTHPAYILGVTLLTASLLIDGCSRKATSAKTTNTKNDSIILDQDELVEYEPENSESNQQISPSVMANNIRGSAGLSLKKEKYLPSTQEYSARSIGKISANAPACIKGPESFRDDKVNIDKCIRYAPPPPANNTEKYTAIYENPFLAAQKNPLSTFSIDVDKASYTNARRFINGNQLPPADAVRIEEFINYFHYDYPQPQGSDPFSINTEISTTPWNPNTKLIHIGLQGRKIATDKLPASNLVFLIDVSGSMDSPEKLPLLKSAFNLLVDQLRAQDKITLIVYAGNAGLVLPSTSGAEKEKIREALNHLQAGGSTAGGAGLKLAYRCALQNIIKDGNNRIILATDGDFNVGVSSDAELIRLIEEKRKSGVFLSVLGFGMGNLKDSKMEQLADKGNGNYAYIDNIMEANKVFVEEFDGTLFTLAKDVKLQIEFNPALVKSYRLIGYENRMLRSEDFNDDTKDAGELGSGHSVTALYEIVPMGVTGETGHNRSTVDPLKYQKNSMRENTLCCKTTSPMRNDSERELMTVKFRYKEPNANTSKLLSRVLLNNNQSWENASENLRFSAAAAGFGLILRASQYKGDLDFNKIIALGKGAKGHDNEGYRTEFIHLVETAKLLSPDQRLGIIQEQGDVEE